MERAHELVAYIRERTAPVLAIVLWHLKDRHPRKEVQTYAVRAAQLAKCTLDRNMSWIAIGIVYVDLPGTADQVTISLVCDG